jgi:hypothetical protein
MLFHFQLDATEDIAPWGGDDQRPNLHWYGLTSGWFWIEVLDQELFRYSQAVLEHWATTYSEFQPALPYEDYQVARYWEDLLNMLPAILDPIPEELARQVATPDEWKRRQERAWHWQEGQEGQAAWDTCYDAFGWWGRRTWDAFHLSKPPQLWIWRVENTIHLRWDNREITLDGLPVWEATTGEVTMPVSAFMEEVTSFHARLLTAMEMRVAAARKNWPRPEVEIDLNALAREQKRRSGWLANAWGQDQQDFSWDYIRLALAEINRHIQQ